MQIWEMWPAKLKKKNHHHTYGCDEATEKHTSLKVKTPEF